jgi:hypothetical protein
VWRFETFLEFTRLGLKGTSIAIARCLVLGGLFETCQELRIGASRIMAFDGTRYAVRVSFAGNRASQLESRRGRSRGRRGAWKTGTGIHVVLLERPVTIPAQEKIKCLFKVFSGRVVSISETNHVLETNLLVRAQSRYHSQLVLFSPNYTEISQQIWVNLLAVDWKCELI